jgi:hypothetical protein
MMKKFLTKASVAAAYLGQKVVLLQEYDWGVMVYPVGAVGTLDALQSDGADGVMAVVVFDTDPLQDSVQISLDDFIPQDLMPEDSLIPEHAVYRNEGCRLARLKSLLVTD